VRVEDSKAYALAVIPPPDVLETQAHLDRELLVDLNLVVGVERKRLVCDIRQRRGVALSVVGQVAGQEVHRSVIASYILTGDSSIRAGGGDAPCARRLRRVRRIRRITLLPG